MKNEYTGKEYDLTELRADGDVSYVEEGFSLSEEFSKEITEQSIIWTHNSSPAQIETDFKGIVTQYTVDGDTWEECEGCPVREVAVYIKSVNS